MRADKGKPPAIAEALKLPCQLALYRVLQEIAIIPLRHRPTLILAHTLKRDEKPLFSMDTLSPRSACSGPGPAIASNTNWPPRPTDATGGVARRLVR